jgi:hypothetical protein
MINDLKEFEKFLKICRKQGVSDVSCNGISVKLGNLPSKPSEDSDEEVPTDGLTPDELIFYHLQNQTGENQ